MTEHSFRENVSIGLDSWFEFLLERVFEIIEIIFACESIIKFEVLILLMKEHGGGSHLPHPWRIGVEIVDHGYFIDQINYKNPNLSLLFKAMFHQG